jgi:hypothetical protein
MISSNLTHLALPNASAVGEPTLLSLIEHPWLLFVADATPLHYLVLIGAIEILPGLFDKIHVPIEIREELSRCRPTISHE